MRRCEHGIYQPEGETKAWGCQFCYPNGHPASETRVPKFNRRGALTITSTGKLPKCPICHIPVCVSEGECTECHTPFSLESPENLRANNKQPGVCPACGSGIHFETGDRKKWSCADCDTVYDAPRKSR